MHNQYQKNHGFTLLEIIAVLIIVAIAALVVTSRISNDRSNLTGRVEALKTHIRYAQSMAMSTDKRSWGIRFNETSNWYCLFRCKSGQNCEWVDAQRISIPGTDSSENRVLLKDGIHISSPTAPILAFDNFGAPYSGDENQVLENKLTDESFSITLDQAGNTETVEVTPITGFVP